MKIMVVDGQGGRIGKLLTEELKRIIPDQKLIAIGTNSIATAVMVKAGADGGATGENPLIFNCSDADIIVGPIGIISANSFLGEISPAMAKAVGESKAQKVLIPLNRCSLTVAGIKDLSVSDFVKLAAEEVALLIARLS